jgi:hypothetical protein
LQVGDQYAGRRVACPGCKTIVVAPGSAAAAPPAPPAPAPAPARAAPARPAAPPPPPPAPFSLVDDDEETPKAKKPAAKAGGYKGSPRPARRGGDEDDDLPRRPARGKLANREPERTRGPKTWSGFGAGCAMARWGLWIEFLGIVYGLALVGYIFTELLKDPRGLAVQIENAGGPMMLLPMFGGLFVGTVLIFLGRARMMSIPRGTGAKKVFLGAFLFTLLRTFALIGSAVLVVMAVSEWASNKDDAAFRVFVAFVFWLVGALPGLLADLTSIPAMAIVGGEIPSLRLRRRAGWITFILQVLSLVYVGVVLAGVYVAQQADIHLKAEEPAARTNSGTRSETATSTTRPPTKEGVTNVVFGSLGVILAIQLAYTALYGSLYGAGQAATAVFREAAEAAEDEEA